MPSPGTPFLSRQRVNPISLTTAFVASIWSIFFLFSPRCFSLFFIERSGPPSLCAIMAQHGEEQQSVVAASHPRALQQESGGEGAEIPPLTNLVSHLHLDPGTYSHPETLGPVLARPFPDGAIELFFSFFDRLRKSLRHHQAFLTVMPTQRHEAASLPPQQNLPRGGGSSEPGRECCVLLSAPEMWSP